MPANLTQQYHKAADAYRRAQGAAEELRCLEAMLRELPKHKGTEKLEAELKQKISRAKDDEQAERKSGKKGLSYRVPRQGAGTVILLGGPNAGKSSLLTHLTRAQADVAEYPFTTQKPLPGMMPWEDVMIQLIDTPPITADFFETSLHGLIRGADLAVLLVDLGSDDGIEQLQELLARLQQTKTRLAAESYLDEEDVGLSFTGTLLAPNKIDDPQAAERLELMHELCPLEFQEFPISITTEQGLEQLQQAIFRGLDVVRVYSKLPAAKDPDRERPFTVRRGGTLVDVAALVHKDFVKGFKFARVWGSEVHDGTVVKADYVVQDKDIVELHM